MSTPALGKTWQGRVVDGKFPLRQWLGGSDHSAVFLTEQGDAKAAIKLVPAENSGNDGLDAEAQLALWAATANLSHPHLIRLHEFGRCQLDDKRLLYVVMELAEENLGEILPVRALAAEEAEQMLQPTAEALAYLHRSGLVHGSIKPSNIMAAGDELKISSDTLCKTGERAGRGFSPYDAPEVAASGVSAAADSWSLGATLVAVMTQSEPEAQSGKAAVSIPETIPQPFREIARGCLKSEPQQRMRASEILRRLQSPAVETPVINPVVAQVVAAHASGEGAKGKAQSRRLVVGVAVIALLLLVWVAAAKFNGHSGTAPASENRISAPAESPTTAAPALSAPVTSAPSPAPSLEATKSASPSTVRGSVLHQVLPEVSRGAQNTIHGRVKVSVQVAVDQTGKVAQARFESAGPSKYFAKQALEAARGWTFNPPQVNGQASTSEWVLRFQFGRGETQAFPSEIKP